MFFAGDLSIAGRSFLFSDCLTDSLEFSEFLLASIDSVFSNT